MTMKSKSNWTPPGKNCGLCGENTCGRFMNRTRSGGKPLTDCPYYPDRQNGSRQQGHQEACYSGRDILGHSYDFVLSPLPGEPSARKIVLPFRSDMVEKMNIRNGDYVLGRPMGAGCPVPHVLKVFRADWVTGLLYTWVVGPQFSREGEVKDVVAYHMIGFEGLATQVAKTPEFGARATFLPGFCMMALNHTALVNMALNKSEGLHLRLEDIRILAGAD